MDGSTKETNPKDAIGANKVPLGLIPATAQVLQALAHMDGALKYGAWNWRVAGVRASIYIDAALRHIQRYKEGENIDSDSGLPHLAHAMACLNILVDAQACGKLTDDRPPSCESFNGIMAIGAEMATTLRKRHADKAPRHYTIDDTGAVA